MIYAHIYIDGELYTRRPMHACPRVGETVRYGTPDKYAKVTEVIWCINEEAPMGNQRVNLRLVTE